MSLSLGAPLLAHLAASPTKLARILTLTRKDGVVKRFTDHDKSITVDSEVYVPWDGVKFASIYSSVGQGIQNTSLTVTFSSAGILEVDVVRGLYDGATVEIAIVNWADTSMGKIIRLVGNVSTIGNNHKGSGIFEVRGLLNRANRMIGEVYSPECRADLGDHRCTVDLDAILDLFTVTSTTASSAVFTGTVVTTQLAEHFAMGIITWLTGDNTGYSMEILQDNVAGTTRTLLLTLPMPHSIVIGDTAAIYPGCNKSIATCLAKFNNAPNFRGEPPMRGSGFV